MADLKKKVWKIIYRNMRGVSVASAITRLIGDSETCAIILSLSVTWATSLPPLSCLIGS